MSSQMPQKKEPCDSNACIVAVKQKLPRKVVIMAEGERVR